MGLAARDHEPLRLWTGSRPTVVIVDDNPSTRELLRVLLADDFDVVGEATNGADSLHVVGSTKPDIVLLDNLMPVMTGEEAAPYMRTLSPATTIVAFSSSLDVLPLWADTFIRKEQLLEVPELLLREHSTVRLG